MRRALQVLALLLFAAALGIVVTMPNSAESQSITQAPTTDMDAKTDDLFNGFGARGTPIDECVAEPIAPTARGNGRFEDNLFIFSERETIADGLGQPTTTLAALNVTNQQIQVHSAKRWSFAPATITTVNSSMRRVGNLFTLAGLTRISSNTFPLLNQSIHSA